VLFVFEGSAMCNELKQAWKHQLLLAFNNNINGY